MGQSQGTLTKPKYNIAPSPPAQNYLNFMQLFEIFGRMVCWHPVDGWRPLQRES